MISFRQEQMQTLTEYAEAVNVATPEMEVNWKKILIGATCLKRYRNLVDWKQKGSWDTLMAQIRMADAKEKLKEENYERKRKEAVMNKNYKAYKYCVKSVMNINNDINKVENESQGDEINEEMIETEFKELTALEGINKGVI